MTCREKLKLEHPDCIDKYCWGGCMSCPSRYGYLEDPEYCSPGGDECTSCWNREVPEETNETTENNKEENMAVVASNIKKTKAQMQEEINKLEKEIANLERYKAYEDVADEMGAMRQAFVNAGFSETEAFTMIMEILKSQINIAFKR